MAEITGRRKGELMRGLFSILEKEPDGLQASEALHRLAQRMVLTEHEKGVYTGGARRFEKIARFATIACVKAGWLVKTKGRWSVTPDGLQAMKMFQDPAVFYDAAFKLYRKWKASQPDAEEDVEENEDTPQKEAEITYEEAAERASKQIEDFLKVMPPYEFQELVASLLGAMGYHVSWIAPPGKDGGIDILALMDPLGTRPPRIKVQVKRQQQTVNVEGLRSFMALLGDGDVGLFVSIGGFTKDASEEARTQEKRRVTLIDLDALLDLWIKHYDKLSDEARRRLPLQPIYFLSPEP